MRGGDFNAATRHPLNPAAAGDVDPISRWLGSEGEYRTLIAASSQGRCEVVRDLLRGRGVNPAPVAGWQEFLQSSTPLSLGTGDLDAGLILPAQGRAGGHRRATGTGPPQTAYSATAPRTGSGGDYSRPDPSARWRAGGARSVRDRRVTEA